jgi:hypothetical protein
MAGSLLEGVWQLKQRDPMTAEQIEIYRRAIAPLQESLAAAKAVRQEVFKWIKSGSRPLECAPEIVEPNPQGA